MNTFPTHRSRLVCKTGGTIALFVILPLVSLTTPASAQTRVSVSGRDVTITVPIDGIGIDAKTASAWKNGAENFWNGAFKGPENPFKSCFNLKLFVDVKPHDYDYPPQADRHRVFGSSGEGPSRAKGTIAYNGDPYQIAADGNFDQELFGGGGFQGEHAAHEVGHLLGLPEEYQVVGTNPRRTTPLPGRANTLMADGGFIDSVLIRRLLDRLRSASHEIPDCLRGKLEFSSQQRIPEAGGTQYFTGSFDIDLTRDKDANVTGTLSGTQSQKLTQPSCPSDTIKSGRISAKLNGVVKEDTMSLDVSNGSYTPPEMTPCPFGRQPSKNLRHIHLAALQPTISSAKEAA